ncbi:MAG: cytochrome c oxidase subunit I [Bacteroidia bacterium]|nr:cytochrome c oxidase subunit I [Bacteroidia bacterium]
MLGAPVDTSTIRTTSHKVVLPFYIYAALSYLVATIFLFISAEAFMTHYFHPQLLSLTHMMTLGWGTMIIIGASHQMIPVISEGKLYSEWLAYFTFGLAALGIPLLLYGFYNFDMGFSARRGGELIVLALTTYLINIGGSISGGRSKNVHTLFVFTSAAWLLFTAVLGLLLVYNFTGVVLPSDSLHYLPLHAHVGIIGWFLLLVIGVASRLIPMFLISKYTNTKLLGLICILINAALLHYLAVFFLQANASWLFIPLTMILLAVLLFAFYCYESYRKRIRRMVDDQMKISLLSVGMILIPVLFLFAILIPILTASGDHITLVLTYGFVIFFGWITALIFGMTFKTLPFIVWNKVYHHRSARGKTPGPKELFSPVVFKIMSLAYLSGFIIFASGILFTSVVTLKVGALLLILTGVMYNLNVFKVITHKAVTK